MTRLNTSIREEIVEKALVKADIPGRKKATLKMRQEWAESVRLAAVGGPAADKKINAISKRFKKALSEFPEDLISRHSLFRSDYDIYVNVAGFQFYAQFGAPFGHNTKNRVYRVTPPSFTLKANDALAKEFHEIEAIESDIAEEEDTIRANVSGVLSEVSSVKKLLEVWPEAKELLPENLSPMKAQLPAVRTEELNAMIGLPSDA